MGGAWPAQASKLAQPRESGAVGVEAAQSDAAKGAAPGPEARATPSAAAKRRARRTGIPAAAVAGKGPNNCENKQRPEASREGRNKKDRIDR